MNLGPSDLEVEDSDGNAGGDAEDSDAGGPSPLITKEEEALLAQLTAKGSGMSARVARELFARVKAAREADPDVLLEALGAERRPVVTLDSDMLDEGEKKKKERSPTAWGFRAGHADKRSWEQARDERHKQAARAPAAAAGGSGPTIEAEGGVAAAESGEAPAPGAAEGAPAEGAAEGGALALDEATMGPVKFEADPDALTPQQLSDAYAEYVGRRAKSEWAALQAVKDHKTLGVLWRCVLAGGTPRPSVHPSPTP